MKKLVVLIGLILILSGCSVNMIEHDPDKAIDTANKFLFDLLREDYSSAYKQHVRDALKKELSFQQFESDLKLSKKERGPIEKADFDGYKPVPGERAIQLYYKVQHKEAGSIVYHLVLEGDGKSGYKIIVGDIGNQMPYPPNSDLGGIEKLNDGIQVEITRDGIKQ